MCIAFHQIFYANHITQFVAKLDELHFGAWVNYFISLHYEVFIMHNILIIEMSGYQLKNVNIVGSL